jgi:hypothetical protein
MPANLFDLVEPTWRFLPDLEYGYWMVRFGEALEKHEDHQGENGIPHPLAGATKITEGGHQMVTLAIAAESGGKRRPL